MNKKKILLIIAAVLIVGIGGIFIYKYITKKDTFLDIVVSEINNLPIINSDDKKQKKNPIPPTASINVPFINQEPDLPTGCEVTALAEVLQFYGFNVTHTELADYYLPTGMELDAGCYMNFFLGSPYDPNGSGCFAPAIVSTANKYLKRHHSKLAAYSISYQDVDKLFTQVAKGNPVIVWTCYDYGQDDIEYTEVELNDGTIFAWPDYEHCTVLSGYDIKKNTVTLTDPTYGVVERNMDDFKNYYQKYYSQAVIIQKRSSEDVKVPVPTIEVP